MTLILSEVKNSGIDYGRVEEDSHLARIVQVVDFGIQPQTDYKTGEAVKSKQRVMITWEFPNSRIEYEKDDGDQVSLPRWLGKEYTLSTSDKSNLMKLVGAIAPQASSLSELLNAPCMVQVGTTSGGNAKVVNIMKAPVDVPELENDPTYFDFDHPTQELFESLPRWQQAKIKEAENYNGFADEWGEDEEDDSNDY